MKSHYPPLDVTQLRAGYQKGRDVVKGISLQALAGSVTTLIGPNGCGKSTLLKSMSKVLAPSEGSVSVNGESIHHLTATEAARLVSMLPQHPVAPEGLQVGELVARGRHPWRRRFGGLSKTDQQAVARACTETNIAHLVDRSVDSLSGGQRQRVWLAMILAQDTPVILLDEPTTFLDPANAIAMLQLIRRQAEAGKIVVMVLHDLTLASQYSDSIFIMKAGEVISEGRPKEAFTPDVLAHAYGLHAEVWDDPTSSGPVIVPRGLSESSEGINLKPLS
ncbi:ABC transporter ATP-binding protein [Corynebacterium cystitidis]|nr:ABC transporter ATP-binding protein [Corynebacterium cystitidis]